MINYVFKIVCFNNYVLNKCAAINVSAYTDRILAISMILYDSYIIHKQIEIKHYEASFSNHPFINLFLS